MAASEFSVILFVFYSDKFERYSFFRELHVTYIITMRRKVDTALEKEAYFYF